MRLCEEEISLEDLYDANSAGRKRTKGTRFDSAFSVARCNPGKCAMTMLEIRKLGLHECVSSFAFLASHLQMSFCFACQHWDP